MYVDSKAGGLRRAGGDRSRLLPGRRYGHPLLRRGQRAIASCCTDSGTPLDQPLTPIAHGLDVSSSVRYTPEALAAARAAFFDAGDDHFVSHDEIVDCWEARP